MASQTISRLKDVARRISTCQEAEQVSKERSASLDLLLRFQRLLVSKLYLGVNGTETLNGYSKRIPTPPSMSRLFGCPVYAHCMTWNIEHDSTLLI